MNIQELEHIIRAAGAIAACRDIVVIGSQAILGAHPDAPSELLVSREADIFPLDAPELAELIEGSIGELSPFHITFGYHAHGVGPETAVLPPNWKQRLIRVESPNTAGAVGWCISPLDLAVSKLAAGREKDIRYVRDMLRAGLITAKDLKAATSELEPDPAALALRRLVKVEAAPN